MRFRTFLTVEVVEGQDLDDRVTTEPGGMPWQESCVVTERARFVLVWEQRWQRAKGGRVDVAELCRRFGVSRQTGYVWIKRYRDANHDVRALEDRSSRPKSSPTATSAAGVESILRAHREHPRWAPRKL